jgi:hypothetical protein
MACHELVVSFLALLRHLLWEQLDDICDVGAWCHVLSRDESSSATTRQRMLSNRAAYSSLTLPLVALLRFLPFFSKNASVSRGKPQEIRFCLFELE